MTQFALLGIDQTLTSEWITVFVSMRNRRLIYALVRLADQRQLGDVREYMPCVEATVGN